jgi:phosphoglycolate phosphatase
MDMAKAAGVSALGVDWGYHESHALLASGAAQILAQFADLPGAVQQVWSSQ